MPVKRLMGVTAIADTQFRSLKEVDRYLAAIKEELKDIGSLLRTYQAQFARVERTGTPIKAALTFTINSDPKKSPKIVSSEIDKFVVPKMDQLRKNFAVVDRLTEMVQEMEVTEANVAVNMKGMSGQPEAVRAIKNMRAAAEKQLQEALSFLEGIGQKYAPSGLKEMIKGVSEKLNEDLQYEDYKIAVYAGETPAEELSFTVYIVLKNLKDESGDIYPKFYLVFTCILAPVSGDKTKLSVEHYVTVMHDFQAPGKFHAGKRVYTVKEALTEIGHLLSLENISHAIGTLPHGISGFDKRFFGAAIADHIHEFKIDPASITFWFLKGTSQKTAQSLMLSLHGNVKALSRNIRNAVVKMRQLEDSEGRLGVKYSFINLAKDDQINVHELDWIKTQFKLNDKSMNDIVKVINKQQRN